MKIFPSHSLKVSMGLKKIPMNISHAIGASNKTILFKLGRENFAKRWNSLRFYLTLKPRVIYKRVTFAAQVGARK